jgi:hypothetical protein
MSDSFENPCFQFENEKIKFQPPFHALEMAPQEFLCFL